MNNLKKIRSGFMLAALMLTLAVMTFPIEARAEEIAYAVLSGEGNNKTLTFKYEEHTLGTNEWKLSDTWGAIEESEPGWYYDREDITQRSRPMPPSIPSPASARMLSR